METNLKNKLKQQIEITKENLEPEVEVLNGLNEFVHLIEIFFEYMESKYAQEDYEESCESLR